MLTNPHKCRHKLMNLCKHGHARTNVMREARATVGVPSHYGRWGLM